MKIQYLINLINEFEYIIGIDEVGRGCIAGPMFVCAVAIKPSTYINGVKDSKLLTPKKREELISIITKNIIDLGIGIASNKTIDKYGIGISLRLAILEAITNLKVEPRLIITDYVNLKNKSFSTFLLSSNLPKKEKYIDLYNRINDFDLKLLDNKNSYYYISIKKADKYIHAVSMASIIAKVIRDRYMKHLSKKYPNYYFEKNKGYLTREHMFSIKKHGFSEVHRTSFNIKSNVI
ncbi:MAG: ribonuclease HII [Brevinematales bacterium]|nr:ribonuclease HII [Brevinematales bacterium]